MKIIFVCTDNVGRSLVAEYCLSKYIEDNRLTGIEVVSAGIDADSDTTGFSWSHIGELKKLGMDASDHQRKQLTKEMASDADIIIAFDNSHVDWIKQELGLDAVLFNKIYKDEDSEIICRGFGEGTCMDDWMINIARYIFDATPVLAQKIIHYHD